MVTAISDSDKHFSVWYVQLDSVMGPSLSASSGSEVGRYRSATLDRFQCYLPPRQPRARVT